VSAAAVPLFRKGKVREMYDVGDGLLLMVASDRVSAFDVVMHEPIPGKGQVLTRLSRFWFERTAGLVPNHVVDAPAPAAAAELAEAHPGRWLLVRRAERIAVECVVRGYLAGSGWAEYRRSGTLAGEALRAGLREAERLDIPAFTPAIKADSGHDENISRAQLREMVGAAVADQLEEASRALYGFAEAYARERGVILADTKFEFGWLDGQLILIDEALTPDSSRYWPADQYAPGRPQPSFDKQFLRDHLESTGWNKQPPPPSLPDYVIEGTAARYAEALRLLAGSAAPARPPAEGEKTLAEGTSDASSAGRTSPR
jgi:phosphoribosylaminoimidazole-succinocarboxamide synthase